MPAGQGGPAGTEPLGDAVRVRSSSWYRFVRVTLRVKQSVLDRWDLAALLCLAASFLLVANVGFKPKPFGDTDFHIEAKALSAALRGEMPWTSVAMTKAPAPVVYYAIPYLFIKQGSSDDDYWRIGVFWTALWMGVSLLLLRRAAARVGGTTAGVFAVVITLLNPFNTYYAFGISAENPAYLGAILMIAAWFWANDKTPADKSSWSSALALALGTTVLILSRPNSALMLPLMVLGAVVLARRGDRAGILLGRSVLVVVLALAVTRMVIAQLPGRPEIARQGSYLAHVMFHGSFQYRTETWDWRFWDIKTRPDSVDYITWSEELASLELEAGRKNVPLASLEYQWIRNDFLRNPLLRLKMVAVRALSIHFARVNSVSRQTFKIGPWEGPAAYWSVHIAINALSVLVLACALIFTFHHPGGLWSVWPIWVPWVALLAFHTLFYAEPRYLLPTRPGLIVGAAALISGVLSQRRRSNVTKSSGSI